MVGPSCCCAHSHSFQTPLLCHSQVQGENSPRVSETLCQENSKTTEEETVFHEDFLFTLSFNKEPTCLFFVFARGSQLSSSLLGSHFTHTAAVLKPSLFPCCWMRPHERLKLNSHENVAGCNHEPNFQYVVWTAKSNSIIFLSRWKFPVLISSFKWFGNHIRIS